ncbi:uncharacterized protein LOC127792254 isoform X2 [Diospyros lotus]|uniref:uncharacterized protein LOC127792254 isoform X2 n=1 Tax=Diospyros lotus TaxID=55363 RepID=UPI00225314E6|nr:uncharacterized protein LOC127792254 isoform X2 [Diospyros lotus]
MHLQPKRQLAGMEEPAKGTVTSLSSLFPAEEAQKASKRVQETIAEREKELHHLRDFIADNTSLIDLVQKLPEELHHDVMVPFGKAAFFPGRLIHTNEFLVLLGEGYYAERTSKQTIDILKRRGKGLQTQFESLKAVTQDLKAEASFFDATAAEAAEGLVEITEEYIDETSYEKVSKSVGKSECCTISGMEESGPPNFLEGENKKAVVEDEDYARIMSRLEELEKEELAAENFNKSVGDEDEEYASKISRVDELQKKELADGSSAELDEEEQKEADFGHYRDQQTFDDKHSNLVQLTNPSKQTKDEHTVGKELPSKLTSEKGLCNQVEGVKLQSPPEDKASRDQSFTVHKSSFAENDMVLPEVKENVQARPQFQNTAFTGSIVEHTHNLEITPREQMTSSKPESPEKSSKPVSRFKMKRR